MIAGAALADFAVLVIDAGVGGFEKGLKGQTKEHALLVRSLGVRKVVVAVNKMDVSSGGGTDGGWSKDRFEEIQQQTLAFLTSTVGFAAQNVVFVPCSGWRGQNVIARRSPSAEDEGKDTGKMPEWYQGPSLVDVLEEVSSEISAARDVETAIKRDLRMTIVDVFRGGLQNPLSIAGRLDSGHLQIGDRVCAQPTGATAVVKGIDVEGLVAANANEDAPDTAAEWCVAGDNVVLHLANLESPSTGANAKEADPSAQLRAGDILCPPGKPIENTSVFTAKVLTFAHMTPMHVAVHRGRLSVPASVARLVAVLDKGSNEVVKRRPKIVQPGSLVRVQVACE
ncbi:Hsp70 suppressor, GTPase facilitates ribosomal subunit dissociation, partial [Ascosphaera atra]